MRHAVGALLRRARENQGLLQMDVADLCGVSRSVLCRLEHADREPRLSVLVMLCGVLGMRFSDVLRMAEDEAFPVGAVPWSHHSVELIGHDPLLDVLLDGRSR
jgi:transcriptional regulator with XRE-family HTH domain